MVASWSFGRWLLLACLVLLPAAVAAVLKEKEGQEEQGERHGERGGRKERRRRERKKEREREKERKKERKKEREATSKHTNHHAKLLLSATHLAIGVEKNSRYLISPGGKMQQLHNRSN